MLAGAALGVAAIWLPDILGIGKETLRFAVIDGAFAPAELAALLVAKIAATALCIGFGFAGGVFSPALLIGILFGALAGVGAEPLLGDLRSDIAIYAICGMVAVTSAVIGAPLTAILIVFELTRNYDLATAAMVSVVFSNLVSYRIFGRSLFDVQLRDGGFDLAAGRDRAILDLRPIDGYLSQDYTALAPDTPPAEAKSRLVDGPPPRGLCRRRRRTLPRHGETRRTGGVGRWRRRGVRRHGRASREARGVDFHGGNVDLGRDGADGRFRRREHPGARGRGRAAGCWAWCSRRPSSRPGWIR